MGHDKHDPREVGILFGVFLLVLACGRELLDESKVREGEKKWMTSLPLFPGI